MLLRQTHVEIQCSEYVTGEQGEGGGGGGGGKKGGCYHKWGAQTPAVTVRPVDVSPFLGEP